MGVKQFKHPILDLSTYSFNSKCVRGCDGDRCLYGYEYRGSSRLLAGLAEK